ncbi:MAG: cytochrome c [Rhodospirillales bacterium]|nr:cytochrome c [Rhodospirillales bacterium]
MLKKTTLAACAALMTVSFMAPAAFANDDGEIKYRKSVMKSVGGHMGALTGIMKSETVNTAHLQLHADSIATLSTIAGDLFPEGSDMGADTTVLPVVWEKPDDFAKAMKQFQDAAAGMSAATKTGDMAQTGAAMGKLGEACKNCHENFREKKEEMKK